MPAARRRRIDGRHRTLIPADWSVEEVRQRVDVTVVAISDRDGITVALALLTDERIEPREASAMWLSSEEPVPVSATWLSPWTRELLRERGASLVDRRAT